MPGSSRADEVAIGDERFEFSLPPEEVHDARLRRRRGGRSRMVSTDTPRVGVLGSLCNPVHLGHLLLCQEATWQLGLSRVVLVPTGHAAAPRPRLPESAADAPAARAGGRHRQPGADGLARRDRAPGPVLHGRHAARAGAALPRQRPRAAARLGSVRGAPDLARARARAAARAHRGGPPAGRLARRAGRCATSSASRCRRSTSRRR